MTNLQFYSRVMAVLGRLRSADDFVWAQILDPHQLWLDNWRGLQMFDGFLHDIPSGVCVQECRYLFLLESQVAVFPPDASYRITHEVAVAGARIPIRWDPLLDGSGDFVCSPTP